MAVLVQRFTVVTVACLLADTPEELGEVARSLDGFSWCADGTLLAVHYLDRHGFRRGLERLAARGLGGAAEILAATEVDPKKALMRDEYEPQLERTAAAADVALLTQCRESVPRWLELGRGRIGRDGPVVGGCRLRAGGARDLALPEGLELGHVVPWDEDYEEGDELLPTWHEYLGALSPKLRSRVLERGPDATLAFLSVSGDYKPFAGVVRESPYVHQEKRVERDPDGTEHRVIERWVKF